MDNSELNEPFLNYKEEEGNEEFEKGIMEKIREGFIAKVYGILAYQIIITSFVIYLGFVSSTFKELLMTSISYYWICFITSIVCLLLPIIIPKLYQIVPINYIILTIFTLSYSWIIGARVCEYI